MQAARRALAHNRDEAARSRVVANVHLGMGAYYAGEMRTAEAAFEEALRSSLARNGRRCASLRSGTSRSSRREGELDHAARLLAETKRAIEDFGVNESSFASRFWIAQGKLLEARQRPCTRRVGIPARGHACPPRQLAARDRPWPARPGDAHAPPRKARRSTGACPRGTTAAGGLPGSRHASRASREDGAVAAADTRPQRIVRDSPWTPNSASESWPYCALWRASCRSARSAPSSTSPSTRSRATREPSSANSAFEAARKRSPAGATSVSCKSAVDSPRVNLTSG